MFFLFDIFGAIAAVGMAIAKMFIKVAIAAIKLIVKVAIAAMVQLLSSSMRWARGNSAGNNVFELVALHHFDWMRARKSQADLDDALRDLNEGLNDKDNNGIPDLYDQDYQSYPDPLGIKFPSRPLIENDYVRCLPRAKTLNPPSVPLGAKGIVRSEEMVGGITSEATGGQFVTIKWNMGHLFERCNALDLNLIGHTL